MEFLCRPDPTDSLLHEVADAAPDNPFHSPEYARAMRSLGHRPWVLALTRAGRIEAGCLGFWREGRASRTVEIPSLPALPAAAGRFWTGLVESCRGAGVSRVVLGSFATPAVEIPPLEGERARRPRREYVLDLAAGADAGALSKNHRRNIERARKAGVFVRRGADPAAAAAHVELMRASLRRRRERGEAGGAEPDGAFARAVLRAGAGELAQAVLDGVVVSSILLLRTTTGAYYHSAGTSPEGMASGASHFLIRTVAERLADEGCRVFNLGGAGEESPGLARFKAGFGARAVSLEAAALWLGRRWGVIAAGVFRRIVGRARRSAVAGRSVG